MIDDHDYSGDNLEEAEIGQIQAIHLNMSAIANVQKLLEKQAEQPSATECVKCGDDIPEARQQLVPGVQLCVVCQSIKERKV